MLASTKHNDTATAALHNRTDAGQSMSAMREVCAERNCVLGCALMDKECLCGVKELSSLPRVPARVLGPRGVLEDTDWQIGTLNI